MADSQDKNKPLAPANFADDLDSMLDDAASSIDSDELMDDDNVIDKLLMENAFDEQEPSSDEEDDFEQLFSDDSVIEVLKVDELAGGPGIDQEIVHTEPEPTEFEAAINFSDDPEMAEIDEFGDLDEFAGEELVAPVRPETDLAESDSGPDIGTDDFTLAEFDISDGEDKTDELAAIPDRDTSFDETSTEFPVDAVAETVTEPDFAVLDDATEFAEDSIKTVVDDAIPAQISQLFSEQEVLKEQLAVLSGSIKSSIDKDQSEEIKRLAKLQNQMKKQLDDNARIPIISYLALAAGSAALVMSGVVVYMGINTGSEMETLTELVSTLEENQTELNTLLIKNNARGMTEISPASEPSTQSVAAQADDRSGSTPVPSVSEQSGDRVGEAMTPIAQLADAGDAVSPKSVEAVQESAQPSPPAAAEKNEQVAALEAKLKALESRIAVAAPQPRPAQKPARKPAAPVKRSPARSVQAARWSVNLISFRQDWYANRKAAEFVKQGIAAKVVPVQVKGETWYRLSVPGFKSRDEASAYATRVKRTHNLDSVWIGKE